jgi:hypothetical protein
MVLHAARYIKGGRKRWRPREMAARWVRSAFAPSVRFMRAEGRSGLHQPPWVRSAQCAESSALVSAGQRLSALANLHLEGEAPAEPLSSTIAGPARQEPRPPAARWVRFRKSRFRSTPVNTGQRRSTGVNPICFVGAGGGWARAGGGGGGGNPAREDKPPPAADKNAG